MLCTSVCELGSILIRAAIPMREEIQVVNEDGIPMSCKAKVWNLFLCLEKGDIEGLSAHITKEKKEASIDDPLG